MLGVPQVLLLSLWCFAVVVRPGLAAVESSASAVTRLLKMLLLGAQKVILNLLGLV